MIAVKKIEVNKVDYADILQGSRKYVKEEKRDSTYKVATFLVKHFWYKPSDISDAIGVLLLVWNQAFYRYCNFALDFEGLEKFLKENEDVIKRLRDVDISSFNWSNEEDTIKKLFDDLLNVLKCRKRKSPVAVSKTLHLLAPTLFPIWDDDISKAYGCYWYDSDLASEKYLKFMAKMKTLSERIVTTYMSKHNVDMATAREAIRKEASLNMPFMKSLLKITDEYNYAYTKY
jgi:hypothetical protein